MKARIGLLFMIAFLGSAAAEVVQHPDLDTSPSSQTERAKRSHVEEKAAPPREPAAQPTPQATPEFTPFEHILRK